MKIILTFVASFLLMAALFYSFPYAWKFFGGTFAWGNSIVYNGKTLFESSDNCSVFYSDNFKEIRQICPEEDRPVIRVWINGIEQSTSSTEMQKNITHSENDRAGNERKIK